MKNSNTCVTVLTPWSLVAALLMILGSSRLPRKNFPNTGTGGFPKGEGTQSWSLLRHNKQKESQTV